MAGPRLASPSIALDAPPWWPVFGRALEPWLVRGVDMGLAVALFLVPLAMGGRVAAGQLLLATAAMWVAACWCLRCCTMPRSSWSWSWAEPVILGAIGLIVLQVVPLPPGVIKTLSPHLYEKLPLWSPDVDPQARLGIWSTLSLMPAATRSALIVLASYGILFLVTSQRVRTIQDVERLLRWVALAGSAMAVFGLLQYMFGNGKYYWFYKYPYSNSLRFPTGSFANRNHFAQFVVLAIGPLIWWLCRSLNQDSDKGTRSGSFSGKRRIQTPDLGHLGVAAFVLMIAIGLCTFTVLLSLSRGGSVSMFLGVAICVLVLHRGSLLNGKTVLFLLVTGALLAACLGIYGYDMVSSRLERVQYTELVEGNSGRAGIWRADAAAITDFPFTGSGAASHAQVYPMYLPDDEVNQHVEYVHADNSYVEIGLEAGITGLILVAAAIGLGVWWCWASLRSCTSRGAMLCMAGIAASLAASVIHAICDFVWYVPACVVPVLLLAAGASRLRHISAGSHEAGRHSLFTPRVAWAAGLVGVGLLAYPVITATWAGLRAEPSWQQSDVQVRKLAALDPSARRDALASIAAELTEVVRWQPDHAIAHARLAEVHVQLFNHSQDSGTTLNARQVRQTAMASAGHFRGNDDLQQWLGRAFGRPCEHLHLAQQHARQALGLCPLLANAYLALATAGFVEGQPAPSPVACVEQALRVRPFDGTVLFEAGQEALLSGDLDRALELWRRSFQCGSYHQQRLFNLLVDRAPAEFFLQTFTMDLAAIKRLAASFVKAGRPDQRQAILRPLAEIARREARQSDPVKAKAAWLEAARAHQQIGEMAERLECLQNAVRCDSSDYDSRLALGMALCQANQVAEAKEHLTWCLRRKPRDEKVRSLLDKLLNQELHVAERPDRKRGS